MKIESLLRKRVGPTELLVALLVLATGLTSHAANGQETKADGTNLSAATAEDTNAAPVKVVRPAEINLPPALAEIVRLAESGAEESVLLAYVEKSAPADRITSDEIVYLQDLGISQAVLKALIQHSKTGRVEGATATEEQPEPESSVTNAPVIASNEPLPVTATTNVAPLTPPTADPFYASLTPYGAWVDVAPYGRCWQPTVVVVSPTWRPYCDNGYWLWSDYGWYWHSYYSWGWAPFHYGRWFHHPVRGWIWWPDRDWGPSWVCWRSSPSYYGWAPLPPGAHFAAGAGWRFHGAAVGVDFGFGLAAAHFTFVSPAHFSDRHVATHRVSAREAPNVFNRTTVINNYVVGSNNRIVNRGVDRARVETATHTRLPEVAVREIPRDANRVTRPDRLSKVGSSEVIYRPGPQISVPPSRVVARPAAASPGLRRPTTLPAAPRSGTAVAPAPPSAPPRVQPAPGSVPTPPNPRAVERPKPPVRPEVTPPPTPAPSKPPQNPTPAPRPPAAPSAEKKGSPPAVSVVPSSQPNRPPISNRFRAPSDPRGDV